LKRVIEREKLREIASRFNMTIVLFGSRAKGKSTPASDYDLLVIYDDPAELEELLRELRGARIPADVHAFNLADALNAMPTSTIILDALEEGVVLKEGISLRGFRERLAALKSAGYRKEAEGWVLRIGE